MFTAAMLCCATLAIDPPSLELSLELAESSVKAGGVVLVKARIENKGEDRISWHCTPSFATNNFWLEVRKSNATAFTKCHPKTEGDDIGTGPTSVEPGSAYAAYDYLLPINNLNIASWNNPFLFDEGDYELRAGFKTTVGEVPTLLYSQVVSLHVIPRLQHESELIHSVRQTLIWAITPVDSDLSHQHDAVLKTVEDNLTASYLRTALVWQRMVRECDPKDPHFAVRLEAVDNLRRVVDPITAEVIAIGLAGELMSHRQWELALAALDQVGEPCEIVITSRQGCRAAIKRMNHDCCASPSTLYNRNEGRIPWLSTLTSSGLLREK